MRVTADWPHRSLRRGIVMDALVQDFNTALDETGTAVVVCVVAAAVVVVFMVSVFFLLLFYQFIVSLLY